MDKQPPHRRATRLAHIGRDPAAHHGLVNPPIAKGSTFLYPDLAAYRVPRDKQDYRYWRLGNPNARDLEGAMAELEHGIGAIVAPSGVAACALPLLTYMRAGGHMLITDSVFDPTRNLANGLVTRAGVEVEYYDPAIGAGIADLIRPNTHLIYLESPGSSTFEVQDVPAIASAARARGVPTACDTTWSSPLAFHPIAHGVDVATISATKYIGGHADITLGVVVARDDTTYRTLKAAAINLGYCAGAEDMWLALRGLRTVELRMARVADSALQIATWLQAQPGVRRVLYPPLPGDPGHALWRRDVTGAAGVFTVQLDAPDDAALGAFLDTLQLFPLGFSWGGYESLAQPFTLSHRRFVPDGLAPDTPGLVRLQIGLEDPADLIADLARGLERMRQTPTR